MTELRELRARDVAAATELGRRAFAARPEQPDFSDELGRSTARAWVALKGEALVGYALAWVAADEAQLMSIAVEASARRRGLARALLDRLLEELREEGVRSLVLEVRTGNAAAIRLYESMGFTKLGERRAYYADGEDGATYQRAV